jgi:hypothetical protein
MRQNERLRLTIFLHNEDRRRAYLPTEPLGIGVGCRAQARAAGRCHVVTTFCVNPAAGSFGLNHNWPWPRLLAKNLVRWSASRGGDTVGLTLLRGVALMATLSMFALELKNASKTRSNTQTNMVAPLLSSVATNSRNHRCPVSLRRASCQIT